MHDDLPAPTDPTTCQSEKVFKVLSRRAGLGVRRDDRGPDAGEYAYEAGRNRRRQWTAPWGSHHGCRRHLRAPRRKMSGWDRALLGDLSRDGHCVVCVARRRAADHYFTTLFYEQITDVSVRAAWRAAWGCCPRHTVRLLDLGDPLGASILYHDLLTSLPPQPGAATGRCPVCVEEEQAALRALTLVDLAVADPDAEPAALCWPHLLEAVRPGSPLSAEARTRVWTSHRAWWLRWAAEVDQVTHADTRSAPPTSFRAWQTVARYFAGDICLPIRAPTTGDPPPAPLDP
jgi:hypothetical protein